MPDDDPRRRFASIEEAIEQIRQGRLLLVVDDEDRENEGDLVMAADRVTAEAINFMAKHGRGLICLSMTAERLDQLEVPLMVEKNTTTFNTAFCVWLFCVPSTSATNECPAAAGVSPPWRTYLTPRRR